MESPVIAAIAVTGDATEVERAAEALRSLVSGLPFFERAEVQSWVAASGLAGAAWVRSVGVHSADVSIWQSSDEAAFVLGQPIRWQADRADGVDILDAERMVAEDPERLAAEIDGRGLLLRVSDRVSGAEGSRPVITIVGDPMHSYPLYGWERNSAVTGGPPALWVTNVPGALVRTGAAADVLVPSRMASAIVYGSSFDAAPWLEGVQRIGGWFGGAPATGARRLQGNPQLRVHSAAPSMAELAALHGRGDIRPEAAAEVLVEITRAMAVRHGAELIVPVSAGKDSRLILAATLKAGLPIRAVTGGAPDSEDFIVGRWLATESGVEHLRISDAQPTRTTHPLETIDLVSRVTAGVVTAGDAHFFPHRPSDIGGTWLSGQAGEIARAFYGAPRGPLTAPMVLLKAMSRRPRRPLPLTARAERAVAREVWTRLRAIQRAGAGAGQLGDLFYLTDRMGRHIGGALLHFELGLDYAAPLWSRRLLPYMWAGTGPQRQRSTFHDEVTLALVQDLPARTQAAFVQAVRGEGGAAARRTLVGGNGAGGAVAASGGAARAGAVAKEAPVEPGGFADDALRAAQLHLIELVSAINAGDPIWQTISRKRASELAGRPGRELDFIERQHVWRLATALHAWHAQGQPTT